MHFNVAVCVPLGGRPDRAERHPQRAAAAAAASQTRARGELPDLAHPPLQPAVLGTAPHSCPMLLAAACTHPSAASGNLTRLRGIDADTDVNNATNTAILSLHGGLKIMGCNKYDLFVHG